MVIRSDKYASLFQRGLFVLIVLAFACAIGCSPFNDSHDDKDTVDPAVEDSRLPIVYVHGGSGSASQFESQAQRFMANDYPKSYLAAYDHSTERGGPEPCEQTDGLDEIIDNIMAATGHSQVNLIGHSRGTFVSSCYLKDPEQAAKIAHYVNVDGGRPDSLLVYGVPTLALWGDFAIYPDVEIEGATHIMDTDQAHIELATSMPSFIEMYKFFNDGEEPETTQIDPASGDYVEIAGAVNYFPSNEGALGVLEIYEVNPDTGFRIDEDNPLGPFTIDETGAWGPLAVKKGASYEFAFTHEAGGGHYFYREPFMADDYFIRLNTSPPGGGTGALLTKTAESTNIVVTRDKEMWGDQGADNDILTVNGQSVLTEAAAARDKNLSALFLVDWGPGGHPDPPIYQFLAAPFNDPDVFYGEHELEQTDLTSPIGIFHAQTFLSGLDLFLPAASSPDETISVVLTPRGGDGKPQTINIPNWPSNEVRVSVHFRDFLPAPLVTY